MSDQLIVEKFIVAKSVNVGNPLAEQEQITYLKAIAGPITFVWTACRVYAFTFSTYPEALNMIQHSLAKVPSEVYQSVVYQVEKIFAV